MNAPTSTNHLAQALFELLPLGAIAPSETQIQAERRRGYDQPALAELAKSIAADGVLMPIVVRPLAALRGLAKYELVAGERRWLAAEKAGQEHILARILELTDVQVLNAQIVENIQRQGLDVLAEARGYRELIAGGVNAETIADMIGKSRSYVYARTKLLDLAPAVQEALADKEIDASQALLFARIPSHKLQEKALSTLDKWSYQGHGEKLSFRRTAEILQEKLKGILIPLVEVPWQLDDATFHVFGPKQGRHGTQEPIFLSTCAACPKRSGNDPELLAALDDANVCTDLECHNEKGKQTFARRRKAAEASGSEILTGDAAAAIAPTQYGTKGYLDLDEPCDDDGYPEPEPRDADGKKLKWDHPEQEAWDERSNNWKPRTYRQLLGADGVAGLELKLVQDPKHKGRIRELAPDKEVLARLKAKGIKSRLQRDTRKPEPAPKQESAEAAKKRTEREARDQAEAELADAIERQTRTTLLKTVHEKWKGPLTRDDLELVLEYFMEESGWPESLEILYPKHAQPATMNERELGRLLISWPICASADGYRNNDRPLKAMCKRLKIDPKAIEKDVRVKLTPKAERGEPAKKSAKKSKRK